MTNQKVFKVAPENSGERLDRFLAREAGMSLRAARRFIERDAVQVDGREQDAARKVREGQTVVLVEEGGLAGTSGALPETGRAFGNGPGMDHQSGTPHLIAATKDFAAFFKPPCLHTMSLAGSPEPSLEAILPKLFPGGQVILVNRLDRGTSGVVLGARNSAAARAFREFEDRDEVDKRYLALARGDVLQPFILKKGLDTANRARTRVLARDSTDSTRWTRIRPVGRLSGLTLVEARIVKGARHQIRAHLADAGHPLSGDDLYGGPPDSRLRLHHWLLRFPAFSACAWPDWSDWTGAYDSNGLEDLKVLIEQFREDSPCESW